MVPQAACEACGEESPLVAEKLENDELLKLHRNTSKPPTLHDDGYLFCHASVVWKQNKPALWPAPGVDER